MMDLLQSAERIHYIVMFCKDNPQYADDALIRIWNLQDRLIVWVESKCGSISKRDECFDVLCNYAIEHNFIDKIKAFTVDSEEHYNFFINAAVNNMVDMLQLCWASDGKISTIKVRVVVLT